MRDAVTLRYQRIAWPGEAWRYVVTARGGALVADVPDRETALKFLIRWAALAQGEAEPELEGES